MNTPILQANGLTKRFGNFTALNNVSLALYPGEVFGYIGPNGAGKTTTINLLLGILKASGGSATVFGKDVWRDAVDIHRRVSFVPGDVNLWPNLTGGEVIDLFTSLRGGADAAKRQQLLRLFELDPTKKCATYSKGNRQKVALVAAFAADSDLYVLDEPTSGLDPLMEQVFRQCVRDLRAAGKTVLLSSHILSEVEQLCDRVSILREGSIIETGALADLRHLTASTVTVETSSPIPSPQTLPGVSGVSQQGSALTFRVDHDQLPLLVAQLAQYGVTRLESAPPSLEELFMRHYGGAGNEQ